MNNNNFYPNGYQANDPTVLVPQQGTTPNQGEPLQAIISPPSTHVEYAENIFYLNIGKKVKAYFSYPDSIEWRDKIFEGVIEDAGRDYLLLKDENGNRILLWLIYISYAIFDEEVIHNYPRPTTR